MSGTATTLKPKVIAWEMAFIAVACLGLAYWFIPAYIPAFDSPGLSPDLLPTASALAMAGLACVSFLLSFRKSHAGREMAGFPWRPVFGIVALCLIGVIVISYFSLSVGALILIPALMLRLGERRWMYIVSFAVISAALIHFIVP